MALSLNVNLTIRWQHVSFISVLGKLSCNTAGYYVLISVLPSNELILAGKLQLKKLQKKKPEKNSGFDGA